MITVNANNAQSARQFLQRLSTVFTRPPINVRAANAAAARRFLQDLPGALNYRKASGLAGVNIDPLFFIPSLAAPTPAELSGFKYVRFAYNVSQGKGSLDLEAAYRLYAPIIDRYLAAGIRPVLVLTHQTYGEGRGFDWLKMTALSWANLRIAYADTVRKIAARYNGARLVYQIWNEQDSALGSPAAVAVPADEYGRLLGETVAAIRSADRGATIISGGSLGGRSAGVAYMKTAVSYAGANPPDAIAFHAYGLHGGAMQKYAPFGSLVDTINAYATVIPGKKLWITEWGVLDQPNAPVSEIAAYASAFMNAAANSGKVEAAIWYAWAESMHNGFGVVGTNGVPRAALRNVFK